MNFLRWFLIIFTAFYGLAYAAILVIGSGFRRSFGASSAIASIEGLLPIPIIVLLLLSLRVGAGRTILHVTAAAVVLAGVYCVTQMTAKFDPSWIFLVHLCLWLLYYALALARAAQS